MAKKPLKGFPKSDAQKMLDRLSAPRKFAEGGLTSALVSAPAFVLSKDQARQKELQKQIDTYKQQVADYNKSLEKYNADIFNPYQARVNEFNTAAAAYNKSLEAYNASTPRVLASNVGESWRPTTTRPGVRGVVRLDLPANSYFVADRVGRGGPIGTYYARDVAAPSPFTMTAPTAPTAFGMTEPTAPLKQEEIDAFAKEAQERAAQNAAARATAMRAVQDPGRFNIGGFGAGDVSGLGGMAGLAGMSAPLFNEGGEVDKESTASRLLKEVVPLDTRTFVSTLFGNRDPITEKNLNADQLSALREVVQTAEQKGRKGNVQYSDYEKFNAGPQHNAHISLSTTLGRFNYVQNPDGSLTVVDRYDFANPGREEAIKAYEGMGPARKALEVAKRTAQRPLAFPLSLASELGNAYIGREGRDVKIQVPPSESKKMLDGVKKPPKK
jgi:hypothetical protein